MPHLLFTCVKNEGPFLLEWLTWYRHLGFEQFLIFSNDCADGTDAMLDRLHDMGLVRHIRNDVGPRGPQWSALNSDALADALTQAQDKAAWALHADIDEFLNPNSGTLAGLLDELGKADAISLPWRFFGNAGIARFRDAPVVTQFTACSPYPAVFPRQAMMCKTLFRPGKWLAKPGIHVPKPKSQSAPLWLDGSGRPVADDFAKRPLLAGASSRNALGQFNHYALRSYDSFLVKSARGLPNRSQIAIDLNYWVLRNFNDETDTGLADRWGDCTEAYAALLADQSLGALHKSACAWHQEQAFAATQTPKGAELYAAIATTGDSRVPPKREAQRIYAAMGAAYGDARSD